MALICLFNWRAKISRCLPICHRSFCQCPRKHSSKQQCLRYLYTANIGNWKHFLCKFRKYTEILALTEEVISCLPKLFTSFLFVYVIFFKTCMVFLPITISNLPLLVLRWWNKWILLTDGHQTLHKSLFSDSNKISLQRKIDRLCSCIYGTKAKIFFRSLEFEKFMDYFYVEACQKQLTYDTQKKRKTVTLIW